MDNSMEIAMARGVAAVNKELVSTGQKDELRASFKEELRLAGWREKVMDVCDKYVNEKGLDKVELDELLRHIHATVQSNEDLKDTCENAVQNVVQEIFKRLTTSS